MRNHTIFFGLLLVAGLWGCSKPVPPPATFVGLLVQADRIVATNRYSAFTFITTGDEVASLSKALASAKRDKNSYATAFAWRAQLYAGTNFLTEIIFSARLFWIEDEQYREDEGVLKAFYEKLQRLEIEKESR